MAMSQFVLECEERAVAGQSTDEIAHAMGVTKDLVNTALNGVTERENGVEPCDFKTSNQSDRIE